MTNEMSRIPDETVIFVSSCSLNNGTYRHGDLCYFIRNVTDSGRVLHFRSCSLNYGNYHGNNIVFVSHFRGSYTDVNFGNSIAFL